MDYAVDVAVDGDDNVHVFGHSSSAGWTADGLDNSHNGQADAFVVRLTSAGAHVWSTYLGGAGSESGLGGALDSSGNILIVGDTTSAGMGTGGDTTFEGSSEGFAVKLTPKCALLWSTYVGGAGSDRCRDIAVDGAGNVFLAGDTTSAGWATGGGNTTFGGSMDAFAARLSPEGEMVWASYLGGTSEESGYGVALAPDGDIRVAGLTLSEGWTAGGWNTTYAGGADGFAASLSADGVGVWSTYLGGTEIEFASGITVDEFGNSYVIGDTLSTEWVSGGWDVTLDGTGDAFVAKLSPLGAHLWSSYGGAPSGTTRGARIRACGNGTLLVTGRTPAAGWITGGWDNVYSGGTDGFLLRVRDVVAVQGLAGQTREEAEAALATAGLAAGTVTEAYSPTVAAGLVISQDPASGTEVPPGAAVGFVVSLGVQPVPVPNVAGMTAAAAGAALGAADLAVGAVTEAYSATVAAGLVLSQNPAAGTQTAPGSPVSLVLSRGPEPAPPAPPTEEETSAALAEDFEAADTDGDGRISREEAETAVPGLTPEIFDQLDTNGDGHLDTGELGMPADGCGCGCKKSRLTPAGLGQKLGDLFLGGLALALLAVMGRRDRS
jgi:hypothetical protein